MNKRKKYILSVITILVIVAACTFGIVKYVGMKKNSTPNNNVNINTDGNKSDKETTLLVEKLSTLTRGSIWYSTSPAYFDITPLISKKATSVQSEITTTFLKTLPHLFIYFIFYVLMREELGRRKTKD